MSRENLADRIKENLFLLDGAMGTQLFAHGIEAGTCNDYLNIESPDIVLNVHKSYFEAGSDAVITNTFGANKIVLARHNLGDKADEINTAAAKTTRQAAGEQRYVLGDIGPAGDFLKPLGQLEPEEMKDAFSQQAKALYDNGADGFIIETMTALDEISIAIEAVKSVCELPILASMSYDRAGKNYKTMMGIGVEQAVLKIVSLGVEAVGFNCGTLSLDEYVELAGQYVSAVKASGRDVCIFAEPNAGKPELVDDNVIYKISGEEFVEAAAKIYSAGINIIGGCCGTAPEHIKAIAKKLKSPR